MMRIVSVQYVRDCGITKRRGSLNIFLATLGPAESIIHFHTWTKALTASLYAVTAKNGF